MLWVINYERRENEYSVTFKFRRFSSTADWVCENEGTCNNKHFESSPNVAVECAKCFWFPTKYTCGNSSKISGSWERCGNPSSVSGTVGKRCPRVSVCSINSKWLVPHVSLLRSFIFWPEFLRKYIPFKLTWIEKYPKFQWNAGHPFQIYTDLLPCEARIQIYWPWGILFEESVVVVTSTNTDRLDRSLYPQGDCTKLMMFSNRDRE